MVEAFEIVVSDFKFLREIAGELGDNTGLVPGDDKTNLFHPSFSTLTIMTQLQLRTTVCFLLQ